MTTTMAIVEMAMAMAMATAMAMARAMMLQSLPMATMMMTTMAAI
jgi:hypothetical protein